ncbi:MAG: HAMP domain-containing histidine kinase, partial [Spirochaetaceae bacterium]|nr:HAMP domain-containing histidine kinase [Spirochaetaceae bacterium]
GMHMQIDTIVAEARLDGSPSTTLLPIPDENGGSGYIIASYRLKGFADQFSSIGRIMPLAFVLFTAIMSVLIIRSINQSISRLETATRRIAEGDLDFKLETSGKDRIASLTRSFDTMRRQLKEQFDRGSRFLMGISHDLKTPLSSISGYIEAIRDGYADTPEKLEKYTSIIHTKTLLLESRISALIDYAKQETREWKASLRPVEIAGFLIEFVSLVEAEAHARRFTFRSTIDLSDDLTVEMDPDMVSRALENLAENAFLYATPGSEILIRAGLRNETIVIEVENEGPGIDPESIPHIFDPLFRGGGDRSGSGFGLGLATVKSVITSHGWEVHVTSNPGQQTMFTVSIPVREPA